jgi:hypothetical protein
MCDGADLLLPTGGNLSVTVIKFETLGDAVEVDWLHFAEAMCVRVEPCALPVVVTVDLKHSCVSVQNLLN